MERTMNEQVLTSDLRTQWHATTEYWKEVGDDQVSMSLESTYQNCKVLMNWTQVFWSIAFRYNDLHYILNEITNVSHNFSFP